MYKNLIFSAIGSVALLTNLTAEVTVKTEFFKIKDLPAEFQKESFGFDSTIVVFEGLPRNKKVSISTGRLRDDFKMKYLDSFPTGNEGEIVNVVSSIGYLPGEPLKLIVSAGRNIKKDITIVPFPIMAKSSIDNATITATLYCLSPENVYLLEYKGFEKNESIIFKSISYHEVIENHRPVEKTGLYIPGVVNKNGGVAKVSITRQNGEILSMDLPWGLEFLKYQYYFDTYGKAIRMIDSKEMNKYPAIQEYFKSS